MNLFATFIILNVVNVLIQTVKSICTVKCGKVVASIVNALAYGLYTYVVIYMNADGLTMFTKALIIGLCNLVGVFVVKSIEEKLKKDKVWKIELAVAEEDFKEVVQKLQLVKVGYSVNGCNNLGRYLVNAYAYNQNESALVKKIIENKDVKYVAIESKVL